MGWCKRQSYTPQELSVSLQQQKKLNISYSFIHTQLYPILILFFIIIFIEVKRKKNYESSKSMP